MSLICICGHRRQDHTLEHIPTKPMPWHRGPCKECGPCDEFVDKEQA